MIPIDPAIEIEAPSWFKRIFAVFAPVKRSEVLTVVILTVNVFLLLTCYYVLKVVREPLILLGGGAEIKAYASAGQTLLLLAVVPAFSWLSNRVNRVRLLTTMQAIFAGCLIVFYLLVQAGAPVGIPFYLWLGIFNVLVVSNFWSFANDLYTEEQGKRLFAVIGIGASIGAIIGAFVPQVLHRAIGIHALMLLAAGGLGVSIVLYRLADRRERRSRDGRRAEAAAGTEPDAETSEKISDSRHGGFTLVIKDRYLRLLAAMLLVATVINTSGEYVVSKMATDRSKAYAAEVVGEAPAPATTAQPTADNAAPGAKAADAKANDAKANDAKTSDAKARPADDAKPAKDPRKQAQDEYLSKFFSNYYGLVNLFSFLLQALIVARLLTSLGIRRALFLMPLVVLGGWFALFLFANVTMVRVVKTAENSLDYSLHNTLRHAVFLPTRREHKYKAKAAIDTFFFRMGDVIAGLGIVVLLVEVLGLGVRAFAILNVGLAVCWLLLAARAGRAHDQLVAANKERDAGTEARAADGAGR
jgi:ATP:ADP antiporter, AAA family